MQDAQEHSLVGPRKMEWFWFILILSWPLFIFLFHSRRKRQEHESGQRRPPGPPGWPVVGNIFDLGELPHQSLYSLRDKFGPVIWLQLGSVGTLVINSAETAAKLFKSHDLAFSDRKCPDALTVHGFNHGSVFIGNYSPYWRVFKKIEVMEFNTVKRVNEGAHIRRKCIDSMIVWIEEAAKESHLSGAKGEIELSHFVFLMSFNMIGNMIFSEDMLNSEAKEWKDFFHSMRKIVKWLGKPNLSDYFPWLKKLDPLGINKGMRMDMGRCLAIVSNFVKEERLERTRDTDNGKKDFLDVLLGFQGDKKESVGKLSERNLNTLLTEIFLAASETTNTTMEWLMSELLNHPTCMRKVREELNIVVGPGRKVEESDIDKLVYLQASVKEALRLHPPVPILLPRNSMEDSNYMGYFIPKDTQVLINVYAIGKDPEVWDEPIDFKPERFLNKNIDLSGQNFGLIPFGAGRRMCAGYVLGLRMLHLTSATLIHTFDWEVGDASDYGAIDMKESMGITLKKLIPLKIIPKKRDL